MSLAPPMIYDGREGRPSKHCFVPCPPDRCDCGASTGFRSPLSEESARRLRDFIRARRVAELRAKGRAAEALAAALE